MHACHFIDPLINGRGRFIRACKWHFAFAGLPPPPFSRRADDLHHRFLVEFYQFSARPSVPLRPLTRHRVADQPCDRLCSCRISMFRVKDSRTEKAEAFSRPPCATELVRYREMEGYIVEKNREGKENLVRKSIRCGGRKIFEGEIWTILWIEILTRYSANFHIAV